jgi:hypothetical protein
MSLLLAAKFIHAEFDHCHIQAEIHGHQSKVFIRNSELQHSIVELQAGGFFILNSDFAMSHLISSGLDMTSRISHSNFSDNYFNIIEDQSNVELLINNSSFNGYDEGTAIYKVGGTLSLTCCSFQNSPTALAIQDGAILNMSNQSFAGNNTFEDCDVLILCNDAYDVLLNKGFNDFSNPAQKIIEGNILAYSCDYTLEGCIHPEIAAEYNLWPQVDFPLGYPLVDIFGIEVSGCDDGGLNECDLTLIDEYPISEYTCKSSHFIDEVKSLYSNHLQGETISEEKTPLTQSHGSPINHFLKDYNPNNPLINTSSFDHVELEEALLFAANASELVDSTGNDSLSVALMHEILTSDLDRTNAEIRWKMLWGQRHMKSALENRFLQNEITSAENENVFHPSVQLYVDVLNVMTDESVVDSTFKEQFYFELDKGQLFRTIGKTSIAYELFDRLDDCSIDSLQQVNLNFWLAQTAAEISVTNQYMNGVPQDSIVASVDSSAFAVPLNLELTDYTFGAIIVSPNEVFYEPCGIQTRSLVKPKPLSQLLVYPIPTSDVIYMEYLGPDKISTIIIWDALGHIVHQENKFLYKGAQWNLNITNKMNSGVYLLRVQNENEMLERRIVVE